MSNYHVFARTYRPQTFRSVVGQDVVVQTLKNAYIQGRTAHAYLFSGPRGTGKTTLARLFAKLLNCATPLEGSEPCCTCQSCLEIAQGSSLEVLEIDGASHRGLDDIRRLSESIGYRTGRAPYSIYLIDEVHMLTKEAFNALLKTLEEPPDKVKFLFATTEPHKIPSTILSRCQRFQLKRIAAADIMATLRSIADSLAITASDGALACIAEHASGSLRDAESLFDQIVSFTSGPITDETVRDVLGLASHEFFLELDRAYSEMDLATCFRLASELFRQGKNLHYFLDDLASHFRTLLLILLSAESLIPPLDPAIEAPLRASAQLFSQEMCLYILDLIVKCAETLPTAICPQIAIEVLLTKIVRARARLPVDHLVKRLQELEERLKKASVEAPPAPAQEMAKPQEKSAPPVLDGQKKARYDTLLEFAKVELEGTIQRNTTLRH